jgi:hypothetical protein
MADERLIKEATTPSVDLNSDLGEGFGSYRCCGDDAMLAIVTSANVACGLTPAEGRGQGITSGNKTG